MYTADPPTAEAPPATPERILRAAETCVRRWGIRRVSMSDVALQAGVSRGSVYRYFSGRDALVQALLERVAVANVAEAEPAVRRQRSLAAKVAEAAVFVRHLADDERRLGLHEHPGEPALATLQLAATPAMFAHWVAFWIPFLDEARASGEVRGDLDVRQASEWIMRILISLVTVPSVTVDLDDPRQLRAYIEDHLVHGFRD
ncbi:MAG TPA: helix-turn-helix domain-containing protein [Acidimicrobiia bacterium]|nr:helix-turn-helix domain-containing protein [Acidimicrobiia bacterium]